MSYRMIRSAAAAGRLSDRMTPKKLAAKKESLHVLRTIGLD